MVDVIILQAIEEVSLEGVPDDGIELDNECVIHPIKARVLGAARTSEPFSTTRSKAPAPPIMYFK